MGLLPSALALCLVTPSHDQDVRQVPDVTRFCRTEFGSNQSTDAMGWLLIAQCVGDLDVSLTRQVAEVVHRHVQAIAKNANLSDVEWGEVELGHIAEVCPVGELAADVVKRALSVFRERVCQRQGHKDAKIKYAKIKYASK
jgi:hypothetical protein